MDCDDNDNDDDDADEETTSCANMRSEVNSHYFMCVCRICAL